MTPALAGAHSAAEAGGSSTATAGGTSTAGAAAYAGSSSSSGVLALVRQQRRCAVRRWLPRAGCVDPELEPDPVKPLRDEMDDDIPL